MQNNILKQVEFYFSDENLKQDSFFHSQIEENGSISFDILMKCNQIKKFQKNKLQLIEQIKQSNEVEINQDCTGVKRKTDRPLPELKVTKKVKLLPNHKSQPQIDDSAKQLEQEIEEIKQVETQHKVYRITATEESPLLKFNILSDYLQQKYGIVQHCIFQNQKEGYVIFLETKLNDKLIKDLQTDTHKINNQNYELCLCNEEMMAKFNEKYTDKFKEYIQTQIKIRSTKLNNLNKCYKKVFTFQNKKYSDINKFKALFQNMITRHENDSRIKEPHHSMVLEFLKFHEDSKSKLQNLDYFTVNPHPQHTDQRVFFVVKKDGTSEDFSIGKCADGLIESLKIGQN